MYHIGFTGTRDGMTQEQWDVVSSLFYSFFGYDVTLHHGDCIGADTNAHNLAEAHGFSIVIHPPINRKYRAFCTTGNPTILPARQYLTRNRNIVDSSFLLIATPNGPEKVRSGTWAAVRYARKVRDPIIIVWPSGETTEENCTQPIKELNSLLEY